MTGSTAKTRRYWHEDEIEYYLDPDEIQVQNPYLFKSDGNNYLPSISTDIRLPTIDDSQYGEIIFDDDFDDF